MDSLSRDTQKQQDEIERALASLPEAMLPLFLSGKSVTDLAHLAKNIIQAVSGSVEIIEVGMERKQYDRVQRSWAVFEPNFLRLKKFVLDLIKYTRRYPLQKTECNFNELVQKGICVYEPMLKNKAVKIQLHQDKTIPPVPLDAGCIEDTVVNLLAHALDNLPEQSGTISVQTRLLEHPRQIGLSVCDDGPALSDEVIRSLAEPFERTRSMCGTGFEIPLAKLCIEGHDGYMDITGMPGRGNQIHVYLPIP
ncbi:MAG: ATP-binding protein [Planctomycetales bacterium]|nr:ATP-binding protein [Planctomycetales bacterium]